MSKIEDLTSKETIKQWWVGDESGYHEFCGYRIPNTLIIKTGAGPTVFDQIALGHRLALEKWIGIEPNHDILEIGCGVGRDAMWLSKTLTTGSYTGIDIIADSIQWCSENISRKHENFSFHHFDVADHLHNPEGRSDVNKFRFPREDSSIDRIFGFSVFTHMYFNQIAHYLREFSRVLRKGGRAYITIFLFDDDVLESAGRHAVTPFDLKFETEIEPGCRISYPSEPLAAIAFTRDRIDPLVFDTGLTMLQDPLNGSWSGYYDNPDDGQDVLLLVK